MGRWTDALIGGGVALVFSLFIPKDPRRRPRRLARETLRQLGDVLESLGRAVSEGNSAAADNGLERGRQTTAGIVAWEASVASSRSTSRVAPAWRKHRRELHQMAQACEFADRAVRGTRVLARRVVAEVRKGFVSEPLGGEIDELGLATRRLSEALGSGQDPEPVRIVLKQIARRLNLESITDPKVHTMVSLMRSITLDLLRAAGVSYSEAVAAFD